MTVAAGNTYELVTLSPLRKVIAARMTEAKQSIPHFRVMVDIDMDQLLALRKQVNSSDPEHPLSVNDFIIKACAMALADVPAVNIQLVGDAIHCYSQVDIAVIIAVDGGLSSPVIRDAANKSVSQISAEVKALAQRAAAGTLKMSEISGGTFSLSNLGMYGVDQFDAIINPPQCAILAAGCVRQQAVVKDGSLGVANIMRVALSMDHRALDGAVGAQYLASLKDFLETPINLMT